MNPRKFRARLGDHRRPMGVSLFTCFDAVPFKCDLREPVTVAAGAVGRLSRRIEPAEPELIQRLESFVHRIIHEEREGIHLRPLPAETDLSLETWLSHTNYSEERKEQMRAAYVPVDELYSWAKEWERILRCPRRKWKRRRDREWFEVGGFPKEEFLDEAKFSRGINARNDTFKAFFGPLEKALSKMLYECPWFVKKIPVVQRADYMRTLLTRFCNKYAFNDYKSFEAMFTQKIMYATDKKVYDYVFQNLPDANKILFVLRTVLMGNNRINYGMFKMIIKAVRMSGEMNTSSANGLDNLLFWLFMCLLILEDDEQSLDRIVSGVPIGGEHTCEKNSVGVIEGDDSACTARGRLPNAEDYARMGFVVTEETFDDPGEGAFCGILQSPDGVCIKNPVKSLAKFPWLPLRYCAAKPHLLRTLYRAKALSLQCELPDCPILRPFADAVVRLTNSCHNRVIKAARHLFDGYEYERFVRSMQLGSRTASISLEARLFLEQKYGIEVSLQYRIERIFECATSLEQLYVGELLPLPPQWRSFFDVLVRLEDTAETSTFPQTSANNDIVKRLYVLMDQSPGARPITVAEMLRSCGARYQA